MRRCDDITAWIRLRKSLGKGPIGFVPTMGALHAGHRSLMEASVAGCAHTVVSIFINPTQFDQPGDLAAYPRSLERDLKMLEDCGVNTVLLPPYEQIYPDNFRYRLTENELSRQFCGAHRPGHFDGVLTVVMRLLNIVRPQRAYFGEKDYQQLQLIRGMVNSFFMDVEIVACPTVREQDGLALSSRNQYLDADSRALAPLLRLALLDSDTPVAARQRLEQAGFDVDYVEDFDGRRLAAARLGNTRLIDNVILAQTDARP